MKKINEILRGYNYVQVRMGENDVREVLDKYLEEKFGLKNMSYYFYIDNSTEVADIAIGYKASDEEFQKIFPKDGEDTGRVLLGEAFDYALNIKGSSVSVYPDDDESTDYLMVEMPAKAVVDANESNDVVYVLSTCDEWKSMSSMSRVGVYRNEEKLKEEIFKRLNDGDIEWQGVTLESMENSIREEWGKDFDASEYDEDFDLEVEIQKAFESKVEEVKEEIFNTPVNRLNEKVEYAFIEKEDIL